MKKIFIGDIKKKEIMLNLENKISEYEHIRVQEQEEKIKINLVSKFNIKNSKPLLLANSCEIEIKEEEKVLYYSLNFFRLKMLFMLLGLFLGSIFLFEGIFSIDSSIQFIMLIFLYFIQKFKTERDFPIFLINLILSSKN
jgi:positive regulator of sigma E activity